MNRRRIVAAIEASVPAGRSWGGLWGPVTRRGSATISNKARRVLPVLAALLGFVLALWRWPILAATGPIWVLYWLHDEVVLPLRGTWERNLPYSAVATAIATLWIVLLAILRARLALLYERGLVGLVTARLGRRVLASWARGTDRLGMGAVMGHALAVADRELERNLVRLGNPGLAEDEAQRALDVLACPVQLRACLLGSSSRAAYHAVRLSLELRLLVRSDARSGLDERLGPCLERLGSSPDELVREGVLVYRLLGRMGQKLPCNEDETHVLAGYCERVARARSDPGSLSAMLDEGQLARTCAFAIALLCDDRDLALDWLDAEEESQFAGDLEILGSRALNRTRPLIDSALLELIGAAPRPWRAGPGPTGDHDASWWQPWMADLRV